MSSAVASILNPGPHGLSEVLYAFTSGANNNGSAFGGLSANTTFFNTALGFAMLFGRFALDRARAGGGRSLARKKHVPGSAGTFPTTPPLFVGLLIGVILIVTALTYFPALSLGPIVEGLSLRCSTCRSAHRWRSLAGCVPQARPAPMGATP